MKEVYAAAFELARMLPPSKIESIAAKLASGVGQQALTVLVHTHEAKQVVSRYFHALKSNDVSNETARDTLLASAHARQATLAEQSVELVLTGPDTPFVATRQTKQVLHNLIDDAKTEIFLVSFVANDWSQTIKKLAEANARGVSIHVFLEASKDDGGTLEYDQSKELRQAIPAAKIYRWGAKSAPYDGGRVHAKIALADGEVAFVSSANFTGHALEKNFEAGVLLRGGEIPRDIHSHLNGLVTLKIFNRT